MVRFLAALAAAGLLAPAAHASGAFSDTNVGNPTLAVNKKGEALVSYTRSNGQPRHVLVWGAVNALPPSQDVAQVHFTFDYAGGWKRYHNGSYWKTFRNACRPYDGPALPYLVVACKAPDGSYWALQSWQRKLPHRGVDPWLPTQSAWSLDISHWTGAPAQVELSVDWPKTFNYETEQIFGRLTYNGVPVHGFGTTGNGAPTDAYGRSLYIDTLDSAYGQGWKRETSVVFRNPTGSFCYAFYPTNDVSLPGHPHRPAGNGNAYRISVIGPGVTPDLVAQVQGIGAYDAGSDADVALERDRLALYDQVTGGDKFCATQR
ncbi:MAG TPA: hypothetical protein VGL76_01270 [Gaiellaceae bacterium]